MSIHPADEWLAPVAPVKAPLHHAATVARKVNAALPSCAGLWWLNLILVPATIAIFIITKGQ